MPSTNFLLSYASPQPLGFLNGVELDVGSYALHGCVPSVFSVPRLDSNKCLGVLKEESIPLFKV